MHRIALAFLFCAGLWMPTATTEPNVAAASVSAPQTTQEDVFQINLGPEGMPFSEFADLYSQMTGKHVFWDARRIANKRIMGRGAMTFKRSEIDRVFRNIFLAHGVAVVTTGDPSLNMVNLEDIKTSQILKQRAQFITLDQLNSGRFASHIVTVLVPLQNVKPNIAQRALNNCLQDHRAGFVHPLEDEKALLISNFGETVRNLVLTCRSIDARAGEVPVPVEKPSQPKSRGRGK